MSVEIQPSHRGRLTARAAAAGESNLQYARHVLAHKDVYRPETVKQAQFAINAAKWRKK